MRILFVFPNNQKNHWRLPLGIAYLISSLEMCGHEVNLYDTTSHGKVSTALGHKINHFKPDLACLSVMSTNYDLALDVARTIKEHSNNIRVMFGGIHPTVAGMKLLKNNYIDYICVGEGERSLLAFLNRYSSNNAYNGDVKGIWYKEGDRYFTNGYSELVENLDELPFPNRRIFDSRHIDNFNDGSPILTARGCPYLCTYCVNPIYKKIYGNNYIRFRSIESVMREMVSIISDYNIESFFIQDETFFIKKERVMRFCDEYKREIGMPFSCMGQATQIDDETLNALKEAGCTRISIGIETGNEQIRQRILKRNITDTQIRTVFEKCRLKGIKTHAFNIIGLPYETKEDVLKTLELNVQCKPTTVQFSIMAPFEGTEIRNIYSDNGWIVNNNINSTYGNTMISMPKMTASKLIYLQDILPYKYYFRDNYFLKYFTSAIFRIPMKYGKLPVLKGVIKKTLDYLFLKELS